MPNTCGNGGVGEFAGGTAPSRKLPRTANRARPVVGALLITATKRLAPRGGLTASTLTRSTVTSTTPSPRIPFTPLNCTVTSRMVTGSGVATWMAIVGAPGGAMITGPLAPSTASSVRPLSITTASS